MQVGEPGLHLAQDHFEAIEGGRRDYCASRRDDDVLASQRIRLKTADDWRVDER
jgi:hypothetical protein